VVGRRGSRDRVFPSLPWFFPTRSPQGCRKRKPRRRRYQKGSAQFGSLAEPSWLSATFPWAVGKSLYGYALRNPTFLGTDSQERRLPVCALRAWTAAEHSLHSWASSLGSRSGPHPSSSHDADPPLESARSYTCVCVCPGCRAGWLA